MPKSRSHSRSIKSATTKLIGNKKRTTAIVLMLVNTVLWGAALPISKFAVDATSPFLFLFYRFLIAGVITLPLLWAHFSRQKFGWKPIGTIVLIELIGTTLNLGLLYLGLQYTTSLDATLITVTEPIFITLGGIFLLREKEQKFEWLGLGIALVGSIALTITPLLHGWTGGFFTPGSLLGNTFVFLATLVSAVYFLLTKRFYKPYPKLFVASLSFWVGVITFAILGWYVTGSAFLPTIQADLTNPTVLLPSLYMAIFGSIFGFTAYIAGQAYIEASEASLFTYLQPIVTIPLALLLHGEPMSMLSVVSLSVIGVGVFVGEKRWKLHR